MKFSSSLKTLMLASSLLTTAAFAQEQAAAEMTPATDAAAPADVSEAAPAEAVETAQAAEAADATEAAPAADVAVEAAPAAPAAPATSAFSAAVMAAIGTPSPGKAMVVFFRPNKMMGGAVGMKVRENDADLVKLYTGQYFIHETEPGQHAYALKGNDVTNIETEAGETYFLSGSISMGMMSGRPNLAPSDAAGFEAALPKMSKLVAKK